MAKEVLVKIEYKYGYSCGDGCCYDYDWDYDHLHLPLLVFKSLEKELNYGSVDCIHSEIEEYYQENYGGDREIKEITSIKLDK
jgi:hypothetical protein